MKKTLKEKKAEKVRFTCCRSYVVDIQSANTYNTWYLSTLSKCKDGQALKFFSIYSHTCTFVTTHQINPILFSTNLYF